MILLRLMEILTPGSVIETGLVLDLSSHHMEHFQRVLIVSG